MSNEQEAGYFHDAFISYSRKDKAFATLIEKALEGFSPPKDIAIPQRRLDIFRDEEDFTGTEYYSAITKHLRSSKKLILICSPAARASSYVNEEIRIFAKANGSGNIIPVLFEGIPNNEASSENAAEMAFPDGLVEAMQMPLAIGYRGFKLGKNTVNKGIYDGSWFSILANLYDISRSDIEQREKKRQARVRNYSIAGIVSVTAALLALLIGILREHIVADQRDTALRSQSVFLARESREQTASGRTDLGIKLALQALPHRLDQSDRPWIWSAESALYIAIAQHQFKLNLGGPRAGFGDKLVGAKINPDGKTAFLDYGVQAELWNLESGEKIKTINADNDQSSISKVTFSPDGKLLAIAYTTHGTVFYGAKFGNQTERGSLVQIFDTHTGDMIHRFQTPGHDKNHLQFSPSGKKLLVATNEWLIEVETDHWEMIIGDKWEELGNDLAPPYSQVAFSLDGNKLAIATDNGYIGVYDHANKSWPVLLNEKGHKIIKLQFLSNEGSMLAFSDGKNVYVASVNASPQVTKLPRQDSETILGLGYRPEIPAIVAITQDARLHSWPLGNEKIDQGADPASKRRLRGAYFNESATAAIVEFEDGEIQYWDIASGVHLPVFSNSAQIRLIDAGFDRQGSTAFLAGNDSFVHIWDKSMEILPQWQADTKGKLASAAIFNTHGPEVAIGYEDGSVEVQDVSKHQSIWKSEGSHEGPVTYLAFDSSGSRLVSASKDKTARIWNMAQQGKPIILAGHEQSVDFADFSPDGKLIVTGSSDSTFRLWDANSGQERNVLAIPDDYLDPIHNASINAQALFTSDGKQLVTVTSGDGYVIGQPALVWDVGTGKLLQALKHEGAAIWDIAITSDNRYLITTSYDNSAALWNIQSGERIRTFSGHPSRIVKAVVNSNRNLLATASVDGTLRIWRMDTGRMVHDLSVSPNLFNLEISHNGQFIVTGSHDASGAIVEMWDLVQGDKLMSQAVPDVDLSPLQGIRFSDDDRYLLTRFESGGLSVWPLLPLGQSLIDLGWQRVGNPGQDLLTKEQRIQFAIEEP